MKTLFAHIPNDACVKANSNGLLCATTDDCESPFEIPSDEKIRWSLEGKQSQLGAMNPFYLPRADFGVMAREAYDVQAPFVFGQPVRKDIVCQRLGRAGGQVLDEDCSIVFDGDQQIIHNSAV